MANSFLQDALRQQNAQRMQGRMMQQEVERLIGRQITGQIGAQEFNSDTQRTQARTQALESAENLAAPDMQLKLSPSTVGSFNEGEAGYVPMGSQRDPFGNPRIDTSFNRATADYTANLEAEELEKLLMSIPQQ